MKFNLKPLKRIISVIILVPIVVKICRYSVIVGSNLMNANANILIEIILGFINIPAGRFECSPSQNVNVVKSIAQ